MITKLKVQPVFNFWHLAFYLIYDAEKKNVNWGKVRNDEKLEKRKCEIVWIKGKRAKSERKLRKKFKNDLV